MWKSQFFESRDFITIDQVQPIETCFAAEIITLRQDWVENNWLLEVKKAKEMFFKIATGKLGAGPGSREMKIPEPTTHGSADHAHLIIPNE